ncbi:cytochrome P450 4V2-like [Haliotis rubra]|uniref:cytochrome P450 4V2-like n=1 Tax=Haliotis rubra TaxID=36100 RepID=UPI001EE51088|nr:cytochrome P450 4V2-like [Haliotis rubra]
MAAVAVIVAVVAIIFVTIWFLQSSRNRKLVNKVPGPAALPLIGNAHQLSPSGADFYGQLLQFAETYKEAGMFRIWLGVTPVIALYKAELSEMLIMQVIVKAKARRFTLTKGKRTSNFRKSQEKSRDQCDKDLKFLEIGFLMNENLIKLPGDRWTKIQSYLLLSLNNKLTVKQYQMILSLLTSAQELTESKTYTKVLETISGSSGSKDSSSFTTEETHSLGGVKAYKTGMASNLHEEGVIAFTLVLHGNSSITSIMEACLWKSDTVFANHYLRDVNTQDVAGGVFTCCSTGRKWHERRKMLTPTFHFKILTDFVLVFNEQAQILKEKLRSKVGSKPFNIFPDITLCALDVICETAMGRNINAQSNSDSEYVNAVYKMSTILLKRMRSPWYWPSVLFNAFGSGSEHDRCLGILHRFTQKVISEKRQEFCSRKETGAVGTEGKEEEVVGRKKRLAFMDMLLHMSNDGVTLSDDDIREEVDTFMFEGHDTTAAAMNWAVFLISSNTRIQQKVHEELDSVFGDSEEPATMENLKDLKYLECCIKEALRLYPSVPSFARTLTKDADIGGLVIPKDASVVLLTSALHRDPRYFPDPEVFNPDRFLPENVKNRHPYTYVPFSAGMRNCIGQKFALLEEKVILSTIFRNFTVRSHQKREDLKPVGDLILRPEKGIFVTLSSRT